LIEEEDVKTEFDLKATVFYDRFSFRIIPKGTRAEISIYVCSI
jgi:hypothetical protein